MNILSRKLRQLESNILGFPPKDQDISLNIGDYDEQLLHNHANQIRETIKGDAQAIVDSKTSPEQQNQAAKKLLSRLTDQEKAILEQSYKFLHYRLERLVYNWFAATYPKGEDQRVALRVLWFFNEMQKLNYVCLIEDFEWDNNRNEDDQDFDDFAWWDKLDAKIKAIYPEGVFSEDSFKEIERLHDELLASKIKEYYDLHPEKRFELINSSNKALEAEKKNE